MDKWKKEITDTELAFSAMAKQEGIPAAFLAFAAEDMVIMRNNELVIGKDALRKRYENSSSGSSEATLEWKPDFVDVATSGDLGYTYGKYILTSTDSTGIISEDTGIFHTVWKRQSDGTWKFVWD
jgi:ketosteroid isomerase-like protein